MSFDRDGRHALSSPPVIQEVRGAAPRADLAEILQRSQILPHGRQLTNTRNRPTPMIPAITDRTEDQGDERQRITNALAQEFADHTLALARSNMDRESKKREVSLKFKAFSRELNTKIGADIHILHVHLNSFILTNLIGTMNRRTTTAPAVDVGQSAVVKTTPSESPSPAASRGAVNANAPNGCLSWRSFLGLVVVTAIAVVVLLLFARNLHSREILRMRRVQLRCELTSK